MKTALAAMAVGAMLLLPAPSAVAAPTVPRAPEPPPSPPHPDPEVDPDLEYPEGILELRPEFVVVEPEEEFAEGLSDLPPEPVFPEPAAEMSEMSEMSEPEPEEPSPRPGRQIMATLTAYSFESCWIPACVTRSGTQARWGVVATDPRVIPLGSRLLIEQYPGTVFIAEDTGGGVLGNHVDIWQPSTHAAVQFGRQRGLVTVLE